MTISIGGEHPDAESGYVEGALPLRPHGIHTLSYRGDQGTWCQRLFRRDLRVRGGDPVHELTEILSRRDRK